MDHEHVAAPTPAREPVHRRFRLAVVVASMVTAIVGSVLLVTHHAGEQATTRGVTATLRIPGHPGWAAAGRDALWVALTGTPLPVRDRPLLRLDLASGTIERRILVGGQASYLTHVRSRLLVSVQHVGGSGAGPSLIVALDWRSGRVLARRQFPSALGPLAEAGKDLWALQVRPAALLRLDPVTLAPKASPLPLSRGRALGLAVGGGYVWVSASDTGEVLRVDPATNAITHVHVGGFPVGVTVVARNVWFLDRERGELGRLDPRTLKPLGKAVRVGGAPASLAWAAGYLFVGDPVRGIVRRVDVRSGKAAGRPIRVAPPANAAPGLAVAPAGDSVWVSSFASSTVARVSAVSATSAPRAVIASSSGTTAANVPALPRGGRLVARIPLGRGSPAPFGGGALTVGEGAVWAIGAAEATLYRIDPGRDAIVARIKVPPPESASAGDGAVWLSYPYSDTVSRVDPATSKVTARIHVGPQPSGIAVSPGAVWVANAGGPSVSRIDPATNRVVATIRVGPKRACCAEHMNLTVAPDGLWVAVPNANRIVRVDPVTDKVVATVELPYCPEASLAADESAVWSAGGGCSDAVGRIDARTNRLTSRLYEPHPVGLGIAFGSVWVAVIDSANVDQIDARTGHLIARLHVGGTPVRLAVGFGSIWVNDDDGRVLRIQPKA
jgi:YVTN family beta-propeller protein